jgi:hypothetical protein
MDEILYAILDGRLQWEPAIRWVLADSDEAVAPVATRGCADAGGAVTPSQFRRHALDFIRKQVAQLLLAGCAVPAFANQISC